MQVIGSFPSLCYTPLHAFQHSRNLDDPSIWARYPGTSMVDRRRRPLSPPPFLGVVIGSKNASSCLVPCVETVKKCHSQTVGPCDSSQAIFSKLECRTTQISLLLLGMILCATESQKAKMLHIINYQQSTINFHKWTPKESLSSHCA